MAQQPLASDSSGRLNYAVVATGGALLLSLIALRLPLWLLPGPGRDEAAYYYWAHHPEPAYAPLLQGVLRLTELGLSHSLWTLRLPALVLGLLVLYLNERRLAAADTPVSMRLLAAAAVALSPWQGFVSAILHPDNFLLAALLGLLIALQKGRLWPSVICAVTAVLAKPTGVLALPVLWLLVDRLPGANRKQTWAARFVLAITAAGLAWALDSRLLTGVAGFGRFADNVSWLGRLGAAAGAVVFLGGPLLLGFLVTGIRQRVATLRKIGPSSDRARREAWAALGSGGLILAVFAAALLLRGQFKGNWVLPAAVLLWPTRVPFWLAGRRGRGLAVCAIVLAGLGSTAQMVALSRPELVATLEESLAGRGLLPGWATYATQAGSRETSVSTSRSWSDHLREFSDQSDFAASLQNHWRERLGRQTPITWILADDYGLACQLAWYLGNPGTTIAIRGDGVFYRSWARFKQSDPEGPLLALSAGAIPGPYGRWLARPLPLMRHPVTSQEVRPLVLIRPNKLLKETEDAESD